MKTHQKLTVILLVVIVAVFYIIKNYNNKEQMQNTGSITMLKKAFSLSTVSSGIDSVTFKKLVPFFKIKKDEFDPNGTLSYIPKDSPERPNGDAIYCYFEQVNDSVSNLRVRMQIENKEWLFFKKCQFLIDGNVYEYCPVNVEFNIGSPGKVCEWFDESVNDNNVEIIRALSNAKEAKVKILGRHYHKILIFSNEQIKSINNTLLLYTAMKGVV